MESKKHNLLKLLHFHVHLCFRHGRDVHLRAHVYRRHDHGVHLRAHVHHRHDHGVRLRVHVYCRHDHGVRLRAHVYHRHDHGGDYLKLISHFYLYKRSGNDFHDELHILIQFQIQYLLF